MEIINVNAPQIKRVENGFVPITNEDVLNVYITLFNNGYNVETLRENLKTLKINVCDEKSLSYYNSVKNEICCPKELYKNNITHELLHASSCIVDGKGIHSGLMNVDWVSQTTICECINEGMTATIDFELFGDYTKNKSEYEEDVYPFAKGIVEYVAMMIPISNLIKYYFESDLVSLINDLNKIYRDDSKIFNFFVDSDFVFSKIDNPNNELKNDEISLLLSSYKNIQLFLAEGIYYKLNKLYEKKVINKYELKENIEVVKDLLSAKIVYDDVFETTSAINEYKNIKRKYLMNKIKEKIHLVK